MARFVLLSLAFIAMTAWDAHAVIVRESQAQNKCDNCSSISTSHTIGSGTDRAIVIDLQWYGASISFTSVTVGGVSAAHVGTITGSCWGVACGVSTWRLAAPASGIQTIAATASGSANINLISASYTGVDQTTPTGTVQTASGTSGAPSLTFSSTAANVIVGSIVIQHAGLTLSPANGATQIASDYDTDGFVQGASSHMPAQTSVTYGWTYSTAQGYAMLAVPLIASTGGGGGGGGGTTFFNETLLWNDNANNEDWYTVQWKHATQSAYADILSLPANTTTYVVQYTSETQRCYRVQAHNAGGDSPFSNELCASVTAAGPIRATLTAPTIGGGAADD